MLLHSNCAHTTDVNISLHTRKFANNRLLNVCISPNTYSDTIILKIGFSYWFINVDDSTILSILLNNNYCTINSIVCCLPFIIATLPWFYFYITILFFLLINNQRPNIPSTLAEPRPKQLLTCIQFPVIFYKKQPLTC